MRKSLRRNFCFYVCVYSGGVYILNDCGCYNICFVYNCYCCYGDEDVCNDDYCCCSDEYVCSVDCCCCSVDV